MEKSFALAIDAGLEMCINLECLPDLFKKKFHYIKWIQSTPYLGQNILVVKDEKMKTHNAFYIIKEDENRFLERITEKCNMSESFKKFQFTFFKLSPTMAFNDYVALAIFYDCECELIEDWKTLKHEFFRELKFSNKAFQLLH